MAFNKVISYTHWEEKGFYLEGTGSMILDRPNRLAYVALSARSSPEVLAAFSEESGYRIVPFSALQTVGDERLPIYHTNVMMCLGETFAVVCAEAIDDEKERTHLLQLLRDTGKELFLISEWQKHHFSGNMLHLKNASGQRLIAMSTQAYRVLEESQKTKLATHGKLIHSDISQIESLGGGSARCMMAEIFKPENTIS